MVVEDEEVSRNLCNYLSQYVFFKEVDLEAILGANLDKIIGFDLLPDV